MACSFLFCPVQFPQTSGRRAAVHSLRVFGQAANRLPSEALQKDYYEILGVGVDASYEEIRKAYRRLQKVHHPDVAGPEGHVMTLLLNEAYRTLTSQELRHAYTSSNVKYGMRGGASVSSYTGFAYSAWNGADRPDAIFVDENTCIGCRECVFHANKTFSMDESIGCARVTTQWGDSDSQIKTAMEACPVNCIHSVDKNDLPILEYLMRPRPKASNGVYGGGWERPSNVFMAANTFKRKIEASSSSSSGDRPYAETPAQRKARIYADLKMQAGAFWWLWSWGVRDSVSFSKQKNKNDAGGWFGLFGTSKSSNVLKLSVEQSEASKVVKVVQQWAMTFASSSELPLPLPFKADPLENGVELTLISASNGLLESKGSLIVTIDEEEDGTFLNVKRRGVTGTSALPGERTIVHHLKDAVQGYDKAYSFYHISPDPMNNTYQP